MDSTQLSIILSAQDKVSSVLSLISGKLREFGLVGEESARKLAGVGKASAETSDKLKLVGAVASGAVAAGVSAIAYESIKAASSFQTMTTTLVTTAGESKDKIDQVRQGMLDISSATGTSAAMLSGAMYTIESAGYHGANGLKILKAAAEGAKTENADLGKVADAVTSAMRDYHLPASAAADVTSKMVAAVGSGKATFEGFTGALHSVLPVASAFHVSLNDILGSLASMTVHGESADQAAQNMAQAIKKLSNPTKDMTNELSQLGIDSSKLNDELGTKGLSGTLQGVSDAIMNKLDKSGKVLLSSFNNNKILARDTAIAFAALSPKLQKLSDTFWSGDMSQKEYKKSLQALDPVSKNLITQYDHLVKQSTGFSSVLKQGKNPLQSYAQALQAATGDSTTMNVALMLTGENAKYTTSAVKAVGQAHAEAGGHVAGWAYIQGNFNQQMSQFHESIKNVSIALGSVLLPAITPLLKTVVNIVTPMAQWIEHHQKLAAIILGSIGVFASFVAIILTAELAFQKIAKTGQILQTVGLATGILQKSLIGTAAAEGEATVATYALNTAFLLNPITLIVAAIIALIAIFAILIIKVKPVREFFERLWKDMKQWFNDGVRFIRTAWDNITNIFRGSAGVVLAIMVPFIGLPLLIISNWKTIIGFFKTLFTNPAQAFKDFVKGLGDIWKTLVSDAIHWPEDLLKLLFAGFKLELTIYKNIAEFIFNMLKKGWEEEIKVAADIGGWIVHLFEAIVKGAPKSLASQLKFGEILYKLFLDGWKLQLKAISNIGEWIESLLKPITSLIPKSAMNVGKNMANMVYSGWKAGLSAIGTWGSDIANAVKGVGGSVVSGAVGVTKSVAGSEVRSEVQGVKNIAGGIQHAAQSFSRADAAVIKKTTGVDLPAVRVAVTGDVGKVWSSFNKKLGDTKPAITGFKDFFSHSVDDITGKTSVKWNQLGSDLKKPLDTTKKAIGIAFDGIKSEAKKAGDGIGSGIKSGFDKATTTAKPAFDAAKVVIKDYLGAVHYVFAVIRGLALVTWWAIYNNIVKPVITFIKDELKKLGSFVSKVWDDIKKAADLAWKFIYNNIVSPVYNSIKSGMNTVKAALSKAWSDIVATVKNTWSTISNAIQSAWNFVKSNIITPAWNFIKGIFDKVKQAGGSVFDPLKSAAQTAWNFVTRLWGGISGWFQGQWNAIVRGASALGSSISSAFGSAMSGLKGAVVGAVNGVIGFLNKGIGGIAGALNSAFGHLPGVPKINAPKIPYLEKGILNFSGGVALVGERGPELVNLPVGADVIPADQTARLVRSSMGNFNKGGAVASAQSAANNHTQTVNIGTVILQDANAVNTFFRKLNQDTLNISRGLTPVQGRY